MKPSLGTESGSVQNPLIRYATEVGWEHIVAAEAAKLRRGEAGTMFYALLEETLLKLNPGIVTAEKGLPFTIFAGKDVSQTGLNQDRAVYLGGDPLGGVACKSAPCENYINPAAFGQPAAGTVGNVGKGALVGPGLFNWDMGLFKNIPITERVKIQLRAEMYNLFNRINLASGAGAVGSNGVISDTIGDFNGAPGLGPGEPFNMQLVGKIIF